VVSPCPWSRPGHDRPHPARVLELSVSVSSPHPRRAYLRLRVNRPLIVWLAARRQDSPASLRVPHFCVLNISPKDKWRLRIRAGSVAAGWPGTSYEKWRSRLADVPQPVQELAHGWFTARTRTRSAPGQTADADSLCPLPLTVHGRGQLRGLNMVANRSRTWIDRCRGLHADAGKSCP
jgi:hypothetical protein